MTRLALCLALGVSLILAACSAPDNSGYRPPRSPTPLGARENTVGLPTPGVTQDSDGNAPGIPELRGNIQSTPSGLRYIDERVGDGPAVQPGQQIRVHYTGWLTNGQKFDSSVDRGQPFPLTVPGQVIQGWNEGLASMSVGGKRRLIIPPNLGYGANGSPPTIPPNATLIFDVEVLP